MPSMLTQLVYKESDPELFWHHWNAYCGTHAPSVRYSNTYLSYLSVYAPPEKDKSFIYLKNDEPAACAYIPIETLGDARQIASAGDYVSAPLAKNARILKAVFREIDKIARSEEIAKALFQIDPLAADVSCNFLQKWDYLDTSLMSYVIDLTPDDLIGAMRKGHRSDTKRLLRDPRASTRVFDKHNPSRDAHEAYRELHRRAAGRITRPKKTFDLQYRMLEEGHAILVTVELDGTSVAASYFETMNGSAIYGSGANDPRFAKYPLSHAMLHAAMVYLKDRGVNRIDTGQPSSPSRQFDYYPDEKQLNIGLFKRGFPGAFRPHYRGIKYFKRGALEKDMKIFLRNYSDAT